MSSIAVVSGIQLINNPRAFKDALALSHSGHNVTVLTSCYSKAGAELSHALLSGTKIEERIVYDETDARIVARLYRLGLKVLTKASKYLHRLTGIESPYQLGHQVLPLLKAAEKMQVDLYIVHLEFGLYVGAKLRSKGCDVIVDMEDWYSHDLLPKDRRDRPIDLLRYLERDLLRQCSATTTSESLSQSIASEYHCPPPRVIHNVFPGPICTKTKFAEIPSLIWFSQTIGPGRGLEVLFEALREISMPLKVNLIGRSRPGYEESLKTLLGKQSGVEVRFKPQLPQRDLFDEIALNDIGFAGELSDCRSRDLTITNKMMEYLRAGLAVVASDTTGHQEVADKVSGVFLYAQSDPSSLLSVLEELLRRGSIPGRQLPEQYQWSVAECEIQSHVMESLGTT